MSTQVRAFWTDFNDPDTHALVAWYRACPEVGERVMLTDGELNVVVATVDGVLAKPDAEHRKDGLVSCLPDFSTWLDGELILTLALNLVEQQTRGTIPLRVTVSESGLPVAARNTT